MKAEQQELIDASGINRADHKTDKDFVRSVVWAVGAVADEEWNGLSHAAQSQYNQAADAINRNEDVTWETTKEAAPEATAEEAPMSKKDKKKKDKKSKKNKDVQTSKKSVISESEETVDQTTPDSAETTHESKGTTADVKVDVSMPLGKIAKIIFLKDQSQKPADVVDVVEAMNHPKFKATSVSTAVTDIKAALGIIDAAGMKVVNK